MIGRTLKGTDRMRSVAGPAYKKSLRICAWLKCMLCDLMSGCSLMLLNVYRLYFHGLLCRKSCCSMLYMGVVYGGRGGWLLYTYAIKPNEPEDVHSTFLVFS